MYWEHTSEREVIGTYHLSTSCTEWSCHLPLDGRSQPKYAQASSALHPQLLALAAQHSAGAGGALTMQGHEYGWDRKGTNTGGTGQVPPLGS